MSRYKDTKQSKIFRSEYVVDFSPVPVSLVKKCNQIMVIPMIRKFT
jgi:hypothetical protein